MPGRRFLIESLKKEDNVKKDLTKKCIYDRMEFENDGKNLLRQVFLGEFFNITASLGIEKKNREDAEYSFQSKGVPIG